MKRLLAVCFVVSCWINSSVAQTGFPRFGSFDEGTNRANLNTNVSIPIASLQGRGLGLSMALVNDSLVYVTDGTTWIGAVDYTGGSSFGWKTTSPFGMTGNSHRTPLCNDGGIHEPFDVWDRYSYQDPSGTVHNFNVSMTDRSSGSGICEGGVTGTFTGYATDGSGYYIDITDPDNPTVTSPTGVSFFGLGYPTQIRDANGNYITQSVASNVTTYTDTLGRAALVITDNIASSHELDYQILSQTGTTLTIAVHYEPYSIKSNFACANISEFTSTGTVLLPHEVVYPAVNGNTLKYTIDYEDNTAQSGYKTGRISQITTPTGATYAYSYSGANGGMDCAGSGMVNLTRTVNGKSTTFTRNTTSRTTTVTPPSVSPSAGAHQKYTFDASWRQTKVQFFADSSESAAFRTIDTTWNTDGTPATAISTLEDGQKSEVATIYDGLGRLTSKAEYGFGSGIVGSLIRTTNISYSSSVPNRTDLVSQVTVTDNTTGAVVSKTEMSYDDFSLTTVTGAAHHNDGFGSTFTARGNLTRTTVYTNAAAATGAIVSQRHYDSLGNVVSATDPSGNTTMFGYADSSAPDGYCVPSGGAYAFVTSVTSPTVNSSNLVSTAKYNYCTGTKYRDTDPNGLNTTYAYDDLGRPTSVTLASGVVVTTAYSDTSDTPSITRSNSFNSAVSATSFDSLGRTTSVQTKDGSSLVSQVDTQYDDLGRVLKVSNPYLPGADTQVWTQNTYDALDRVTVVTPPSGGTYQTSYLANTVTTTDPAGKQRKSYADALGRLVRVDEPGTVLITSPDPIGSIAIGGNEQSAVTNPGAQAMAAVSISGRVHNGRICDPNCSPQIYTDSGDVWVTINGYTVSPSYSSPTTDTALSLATSIANGFTNGAGSPVTASVSSTSSSSATITFTARDKGPNYSLNAGTDWDSFNWASPSFTVTKSGSTMTGGVYPVTAYDSGTVNVTVGSYTASVSYGQTSTSASVASALAANFNAAGGSPVNATANSNTIAFSDRATGSNAYAYSSSTTHSSTFASASFSVTPASGTLNSTDHETAPSLATPWTTTYAYDALDRLRTVNQGVQTRTYVYDDAGRLTSVTTPESGKTDYTYYAHGGVYQRTDARGIVTTYSYDALNRPTTTTYNDNGTPSVTLAYDAGGAAAHALGQLTSMIDGSGSETLTYDNLGRLFSRVKVISGNSYTVGYGYDDMGDLTSLTYPSGRVVTQSYDRIGRMTTIASAGTNYLSGATYNAAGKTLGFTYGNGITAAFTYNDHQQLETLKYSNALTDIFKLTYGYGANNNSQIASITDNVNGNVRSMAYTYDQVGRLKSAQTVDLTSANTWKLEWTYDRYGNRLTQTQTGGTASTPQPQVTVNPANNHIFFNPPPAPEPYDAAGNMTSDGIHTYTYDAENRIKSLDGGGTYAYDGNNIRVQYGNTMYVFSGSKVIAEYTSSGLQKEYVYAGGQLLLSLDVSGTLVYAHMDHLSTRVELDGSQSTVRSFGHFPFGEVWYETGTVNKSKFTTYERDVEVDYAMMRYYHPRLGRFMTSDPISGSTADPQSLNSFSYVMGDPIKLTDALGLCPKPSIPGHCSGIMYPTTWNPNADRKDPSCGINIFCIGGPFHGNPNCVGAECVRTGMAQVSGSSAYADNVGIGGWGYVNGWVCVTTHDSATNTSGGGCTWERIPTPTQGAYNLYSYEARAAGETPLDRLGWLTFQGSRKAWNTAAHGLPAVCGPFGGFFYFHVYGPVNGIVEWDSQDGWSAGGLGEIGPFGGTATAAKNGIHKEGLIFAGPEEGLGAFSTISRTPQVGPYYGFKIPKTNIAAGVGAYVTVKSVADCN